MCEYLYTDKNTLEQYCELLDEPCDGISNMRCPLLTE
jgi:hypothetical protein